MRAQAYRLSCKVDALVTSSMALRTFVHCTALLDNTCLFHTNIDVLPFELPLDIDVSLYNVFPYLSLSCNIIVEYVWIIHYRDLSTLFVCRTTCHSDKLYILCYCTYSIPLCNLKFEHTIIAIGITAPVWKKKLKSILFI